MRYKIPKNPAGKTKTFPKILWRDDLYKKTGEGFHHYKIIGGKRYSLLRVLGTRGMALDLVKEFRDGGWFTRTFLFRERGLLSGGGPLWVIYARKG